MQCKCGSFAINDDPEQALCDRCWRDAKIASLEANVARLQKIVDELHRTCGLEMNDETQGPPETCCNMWTRIEEASKKARKP